MVFLSITKKLETKNKTVLEVQIKILQRLTWNCCKAQYKKLVCLTVDSFFLFYFLIHQFVVVVNVMTASKPFINITSYLLRNTSNVCINMYVYTFGTLLEVLFFFYIYFLDFLHYWELLKTFINVNHFIFYFYSTVHPWLDPGGGTTRGRELH